MATLYCEPVSINAALAASPTIRSNILGFAAEMFFRLDDEAALSSSSVLSITCQRVAEKLVETFGETADDLHKIALDLIREARGW